MGDLWNPFDANNPVYVKLAKEMKQSRKRTRNAFLIVGVLLLVSAPPLITNIYGGPVNQFGVISRK